MTTLLVTGGAGFIGSAIVQTALDRGFRVRVIDSLRPDVHGAAYRPDPRVTFIEADIRDRATLDVALFNADVVCHQAAKVGLGVNFADAPDYVSSNDLGTAELLAAMAAAGTQRLVLASSMVVYGEGNYRDRDGNSARPAARTVHDLDAGQFDPRDSGGRVLEPQLITEDAPVDPRNVYAISKLTGEYLAASWARSTGGRAIALRYHNVYGPGMPQNTPYAGVASLFRSAVERGEAPRVFEDGGQRRDFVHVRDVASANMAAIAATESFGSGQRDGAGDGAGISSSNGAGIGAGAGSSTTRTEGTFRAYNVGSGVIHTIGDLAERIATYTNSPAPIVTGEYRLGDVRHITASSDRIRRELGWSPKMTFDEGMREFAEAPLRAAVKP